MAIRDHCAVVPACRSSVEASCHWEVVKLDSELLEVKEADMT